MDDTPRPYYAVDPVTEYTIRSMAAALRRVQRRHAPVLGEITQTIVLRALAMVPENRTPLSRCVNIDESWPRDD